MNDIEARLNLRLIQALESIAESLTIIVDLESSSRPAGTWDPGVEPDLFDEDGDEQ